MIHKKIENPSDSTIFEFTVEVTKDMAPFANIIVYYIHSSGATNYDRLRINVEKELMSRVSSLNLEWSGSGRAREASISGQVKRGRGVGGRG